MIDIQVKESLPGVSLDPKLRNDLTVFRFDVDRYRDGLALAEVPETAMDTLGAEFDHAGVIWSPNSVFYYPDTHKIKARADPLPNDPGVLKSFRTWKDVDLSESSVINYGLAETAQVMADEVLRHPDIVAADRLSEPRGNTGRIFSIGVAMLSGAALGGQYSEAAGISRYPIVGSVAGGLVAGMLDVGGLGLWQSRPSQRSRDTQITQHENATAARAIKFAHRPEVRDVFNGVLQIEFVR